MKQVDLWLDEDVTVQDAEGNIYSGINHIDSRIADGYAETYDGEVYLFSDMDGQMLSEVEQIIEDYADGETSTLQPKTAKAIGWVRDEKGNVKDYTVKDTCNCITQFSGGSGFKDPDTGMANTSPYVLLEY